MIGGVRLSLMVGPVVAVPAPRMVTEAVESVTVETHSGETPSGFEITFALEKGSPLETVFMLTGGSAIPIMRVILAVTMDGVSQPLIDGVMTHHQLQPGSGGGPPKLVVQGKDLTAVMDVVDFNGLPYPAMPPFARVALITAKYAALGLAPKILPDLAMDVPLPIDRIPQQIGSDLAYIRSLTAQTGYEFYVEPGPTAGTSYAYYGPPLRFGPRQRALSADMDAGANVKSLSFRFDNQQTEMPIVSIFNKETKATIPIPIPAANPLAPPLAAIPPLPPKIRYLTENARLPAPAAIMKGVAHAAAMGDAVTGSGSLDVLRYGRILTSRALVGVRGVGAAFDGDYFVKSVTHQITRGGYEQSFTLARNGLLPISPRVAA